METKGRQKETKGGQKETDGVPIDVMAALMKSDKSSGGEGFDLMGYQKMFATTNNNNKREKR